MPGNPRPDPRTVCWCGLLLTVFFAGVGLFWHAFLLLWPFPGLFVGCCGLMLAFSCAAVWLAFLLLWATSGESFCSCGLLLAFGFAAVACFWRAFVHRAGLRVGCKWLKRNESPKASLGNFF